MRVTGAADPTVAIKDTLSGKLPQRKIVTGAANGYSSYGNQIGLATGLVDEIYHPNYVAKRMEIGAVMGAAPRENVIRENSETHRGIQEALPHLPPVREQLRHLSRERRLRFAKTPRASEAHPEGLL